MAKEKKIKKKDTKVKKKIKKNIQKGYAYISCTYNNTLISIADVDGNVLAFSSPGAIGFSGSRKSTAYAATKAAIDAVEKVKAYGMKEVSVKVKGSGMGRQAAVKGLTSGGLKVKALMDVTGIPHGGCSPRKKPRGS